MIAKPNILRVVSTAERLGATSVLASSKSHRLVVATNERGIAKEWAVEGGGVGARYSICEGLPNPCHRAELEQRQPNHPHEAGIRSNLIDLGGGESHSREYAAGGVSGESSRIHPRSTLHPFTASCSKHP